MDLNIINIILAFFEGFALIISPCILPILPLILSGSLTGSKARPFGVITGFIIVFSIVVLFSRVLFTYAHLDPMLIRNIAFIILLLLGVIMISSYLTEKFALLTSRLTSVGSKWQTANNTQSGFWGGFVFGGMVGIIWTPCAGPILAAVIVQVAIQQTTFNGVLAMIAFAIGAGVPMFLIAWIGRSVMTNFRFFKEKAEIFRKILGGIIIISVFYLMYDAGVVSAQPVSNTQTPTPTSQTVTSGPAIVGIDAWINSPPLQLSQLKGKVVLIDFWTYSCINCIRTLPYLKQWYEKYHDKGFVIIGIHTPEFEFEKNLANVQAAVQKFGIHYPVALDNQYATWLSFNNHYWPAHYLINQAGEIVDEHFGEGAYDETENKIRHLLGMKDATSATSEEQIAWTLTPETYLGYARAARFVNLQPMLHNSTAEYHYPSVIPTDSWALQGKWMIDADRILAASSGAAIKLHFQARKVHAVMGAPAGKSVKIKVHVNQANTTREIEVTNHQLYTLVDLGQPGEDTLELTALSRDLEIYTFTFG